jgi:hypothetical protein
VLRVSFLRLFGLVPSIRFERLGLLLIVVRQLPQGIRSLGIVDRLRDAARLLRLPRRRVLRSMTLNRSACWRFLAREDAVCNHSSWRGPRNEPAKCGLERTISAAIDFQTRYWRPVMRGIPTVVCAAAIALASGGAAQAKGCIKGAVVGGVAGHMAGHGKLGAAAGCAIGHHEANKAEANKAEANKNSAQPPSDHK